MKQVRFVFLLFSYTDVNFAYLGFRVIMTSRDESRGLKQAQRIRRDVPSAKIEVLKLDLSSLKEVKQFADDFLKNFDRLDVLICNAGVGIENYGKSVTRDGLNSIMGVNHVAHQYLSSLLGPLIEKSKNGKFIMVSSNLAYGAKRHNQQGWTDKMQSPTKYGLGDYCDSKLAK